MWTFQADRTMRRRRLLIVALLTLGASSARALEAPALAAQTTIHRDRFGVPHIEAPTNAGVVFGYAYAQAEDYFWQIEDTYLQAIGRYAEVVGEAGLGSDLLNRTFEIVPRSRADYAAVNAELKVLYEAYVAGLNYYLARHPEEVPRLIREFEPWMVLAFSRQTLLGFVYGKAHVGRPNTRDLRAPEPTGSNAWAIGPARTRSGRAMLFVNPHQPFFGSGQWYEAHLKSGEGLHFAGAGFFGSPLPSIGHNERLGWSHTVNEPDVADAFRVTFDDPKNPLQYRYGEGYRQATEWAETIRVRTADGVEESRYRFRKSHHGPLVVKEDDQRWIAVRIAQLFEGDRLSQTLAMIKARNFEQWKTAMSALSLMMFNTVYADADGNIFYVYNGAVPRRDPRLDWTRPVDGADPAAEWNGLHAFDELPQILNPPSGYVQNCNSSPFTTTDDGNPSPRDFPPYLAEDQNDDKRRAKVSRMLLRDARDVTFEDWQRLAFDTTLYWPLTELPRYARALEPLALRRPDLAARVRPYLDHLLDWDCKVTADSTQATLCAQWYDELYGPGYPAETLRAPYVEDPDARFEALVRAADALQGLYGDWRVPWGETRRLQRHANYADAALIPFSDAAESVPCLGAPGPLGVVFNTYYTPATPERKRRYGAVGHSFVAVYEFGEKIKAETLLPFGQSAHPGSPHFFDQAQLYSRRQFKPAWFDWPDVLANTVAAYHPGEEGK